MADLSIRDDRAEKVVPNGLNRVAETLVRLTRLQLINICEKVGFSTAVGRAQFVKSCVMNTLSEIGPPCSMVERIEFGLEQLKKHEQTDDTAAVSSFQLGKQLKTEEESHLEPLLSPLPCYEEVVRFLGPEKLAGTRCGIKGKPKQMLLTTPLLMSSSAMKRFLYSNHNGWQLLLRMFRCDEKKLAENRIDGYPEKLPQLKVFFDGVAAPPPEKIQNLTRSLQYASAPINLTSSLVAANTGSPTVHYLDFIWTDDGKDYSFVISLYRKLSPDEAVEKVRLCCSEVTQEETQELIRRALGRSVICDADADADVQLVERDSLNVSLICPVTMRPLSAGYAARTAGCSHVDCFDVDAFVKMKAAELSPSCSVLWKCPMSGCNASACPTELVLDLFFDFLLRTCPGVNKVRLDENCQVFETMPQLKRLHSEGEEDREAATQFESELSALSSGEPLSKRRQIVNG